MSPRTVRAVPTTDRTAPHPEPVATLGASRWVLGAGPRSPSCNAHYMWYARTPVVVRPSATIICIGLLSHICLPRRQRFPRGAGLLAQWRRAHARASLRRSRSSCRASSHSTPRASSQLPHWRESECLLWPLIDYDCLPHWRESRESRRCGRVANSSIGRSRPVWGLRGWQRRRGASRAPSRWLAWLRA